MVNILPWASSGGRGAGGRIDRQSRGTYRPTKLGAVLNVSCIKREWRPLQGAVLNVSGIRYERSSRIQQGLRTFTGHAWRGAESVSNHIVPYHPTGCGRGQPRREASQRRRSQPAGQELTTRFGKIHCVRAGGWGRGRCAAGRLLQVGRPAAAAERDVCRDVASHGVCDVGVSGTTPLRR